jgi:hypothetical protein
MIIIQYKYNPYNRTHTHTHTHKVCHMSMKAEIKITHLHTHEKSLNKFSPHRPPKEPTLPKPM